MNPLGTVVESVAVLLPPLSVTLNVLLSGPVVTFAVAVSVPTVVPKPQFPELELPVGVSVRPNAALA